MEPLLEKTIGFSDCAYIKQIKVLEAVMFKTKQVKIGRGKKAKFIEEFVYQSEGDNEIRLKIKNSLKYYTDRCLNSETTKKEL